MEADSAGAARRGQALPPAHGGELMKVLRRVRAVLFAPASTWRAVAAEHTGAAARHVAVLAAIPAVARFAGGALIGVAAPNGAVVRTPALIGLLGAVADYATAWAAVAVVALVTNVAAPGFGGKRSFQNAFKLAAYSFTPYWLAGICMLFPGLRFLAALGLYGLHLAWTGLPPLMRSPPDRSLGYVILVAAGAIAAIILALKLPDLLLQARPG